MPLQMPGTRQELEAAIVDLVSTATDEQLQAVYNTLVPADPTGLAEAKKVREFAERNREQFRRLGNSPQRMAHAFSEARKRRPKLTAGEFLGVDV